MDLMGYSELYYSHVMTSEWEMTSLVLQTLYQSHNGLNIVEVLKFVLEWNHNHGIAAITDNAGNMDVAVREVGVFTHHSVLHTL